MTIKRRARTDEQKQNRRQALLDTAWELFQEKPYNDIAIAEIARAAGLAKGTVYLYFQTKEALFLAIADQQLDEWFGFVERHFQEMAGCNDIARVADVLCRSLDERPAMLSLFTILHVILEQNVGYESAQQFKRNLLDHIRVSSALLEVSLPSLTPGVGIRFFLWAYALVIGLKQLVDPAPLIKEVIGTDAALAAFDLDFCTECTAALAAFLSGLQQ